MKTIAQEEKPVHLHVTREIFLSRKKKSCSQTRHASTFASANAREKLPPGIPPDRQQISRWRSPAARRDGPAHGSEGGKRFQNRALRPPGTGRSGGGSFAFSGKEPPGPVGGWAGHGGGLMLVPFQVSVPAGRTADRCRAPAVVGFGEATRGAEVPAGPARASWRTLGDTHLLRLRAPGRLGSTGGGLEACEVARASFSSSRIDERLLG
jgi:hypothetical protein